MSKQNQQEKNPDRRSEETGGGPRVFEPAFKVEVARRLLAGESATKLHRELGIRRSVLYRWRDAYRREGPAGVSRQPGRPPGRASKAPPGPRAAAAPQTEAEQAAKRIAELERKVGRQAMEIDFLARAFKRVKELAPPSGGSGASGSTAQSAPGSALKDN